MFILRVKDSWEKLSCFSEKLRKFSPVKLSLFTVYLEGKYLGSQLMA